MEQRTEEWKAPGFLAHGLHAGIKEGNTKDLALLFSSVPAQAAGLFTTNRFPAAPVTLDRERLQAGRAQAVLVNSGIANAATGPEGYDDALAMTRAAARALGIDEALVLVASTGVIGPRIPLDKVRDAMPDLVSGLAEDGLCRAEEAILTTDRFPKMAIRRQAIGGKDVTVCGLAKGAGMIEPHMATMLAFALTDARIQPGALREALRYAVDRSLNAISVDGCMSTNDTTIVLANGLSGGGDLTPPSWPFRRFRDMLGEVLGELAEAMVRDGEGATKVVRLSVVEARSRREARRVAYAVANANLVKTAFFGGDPNWGRILAAAGAAGVAFPPETFRLCIEDTPIYPVGRGAAGQEEALRRIMAQETIRVRIHLGMGRCAFAMAFSDLTHDYVKINAHYRT